MRGWRIVLPVVVLAMGLVVSVSRASPVVAESGIHKIKHIVMIMQENRSFDEYFGTFPRADGLPENVCVPDPRAHKCQRPYPDHRDVNGGGEHDLDNAAADVHGGRMD